MQFAHEVKASILWEAYKDRLSQSKFGSMLFDLGDFLFHSSELASLEEPFYYRKLTK
jgi:hypothetical protein